MTIDFLKMHIARLLKAAAELTASGEECRAKLASAVALQDDFNVEFYRARVVFYFAQAAQMEKNADMYAHKLAEQVAA